MSRTPDDAEQLALPFPLTRADRARRAARHAGTVLGRVLQVALRWLFRLALPLLCAAALLQAFPYHATVQGVPFEVQGSLFTRPGLSADTTLGSWEFPQVSGVPFGVHVSPEDVDVLELTRLAGGDLPGFVQRLQADFTAQLPRIAVWLVGELLLGLAIGLAVAAALGMSVRYLRGRPRQPHELRRRALGAGAAVLVTLAVAGYGVLTYNPGWVRDSRLTGTLAAAQLFPDQLSQYYSQQSKALDVLGSVVGIQAALQAQIEDDQTPETALQIMVVSDMHLAANYPLVGQYATNYGVDLVLNAGDESEFGTREELTPAYLDGIRAVTATTPMLWIAGNHDSPATVDIMATVPGVTVLGTKTATDDGYAVTAGVVQAYGLRIAGLSDPRVYGAPGAYGADDTSVTDPLEADAVAAAVGGAETAADGTATSSAPADGDTAAGPEPVDVFLVHEPVAAEAVREELPGVVRQTVSGHVHAQNDSDDVQDDDGAIDLVEGATGAG
ncbi:metallophosphoesterase family protein, partial [Modestobacter altitudinis]|uniref:metallophosphoesterase family protein n=1 Tax=Modestobacter altitudinis TaxID=2213158 RepID=UPI00110D2026